MLIIKVLQQSNAPTQQSSTKWVLAHQTILWRWMQVAEHKQNSMWSLTQMFGQAKKARTLVKTPEILGSARKRKQVQSHIASIVLILSALVA